MAPPDAFSWGKTRFFLCFLPGKLNAKSGPLWGCPHKKRAYFFAGSIGEFSEHMRMKHELKVFEPSDPERPTVFKLKDGRICYRASELGRCTRALVLARLGYLPEEPDEDSLRIMNEGNIHEPWAARWWQEENGGYLQRQVKFEIKITDSILVSGTMDGIWFPSADDLDESCFAIETSGTKFDPEVVRYHKKIKKDTPVFGVEIKAPGDSMFSDQAKNGPIDSYKMQISVYWMAAEEILGVQLCGFVFILRRRSDGLQHAVIIDKPYFTKEQIVERILEVERLAKLGYDSVECDTKDWYCKYWKHHKKEDEESTVYDESLSTLAEEYTALKSQIDELTTKANGIKEEIKLAMKGRKSVSTGSHSLYWSSKSRINEEAIVKNRPELVSAYQKFDVDSCIKEHPELKKEFSISGEPYLTVRSTKKKESTNKNKLIQLKNADPEQVLKSLLGESEGETS